MVDQHALTSRLSALAGYCDRLEGFRQLSREEFLGDEDVFQLAERYLHLQPIARRGAAKSAGCGGAPAFVCRRRLGLHCHPATLTGRKLGSARQPLACVWGISSADCAVAR